MYEAERRATPKAWDGRPLDSWQMEMEFDYPITNDHLNDWLSEYGFEYSEDDQGFCYMDIQIYGQLINIMFIEDMEALTYPFKIVSVQIIDKEVH